MIKSLLSILLNNLISHNAFARIKYSDTFAFVFNNHYATSFTKNAAVYLPQNIYLLF